MNREVLDCAALPLSTKRSLSRSANERRLVALAEGRLPQTPASIVVETTVTAIETTYASLAKTTVHVFEADSVL